jgi:fumarate hydratase subunit alpha
MSKIDVREISSNIAQMCIEANYRLPKDVLSALNKSVKKESSPIGKGILDDLITNASIANDKDVPICQDTGMAVLFIEIGQNVQLVGGDVNEAIHQGVRDGYEKGYLRKSVVADPLERVNTKDNTPAIIHYNIVPGDQVKITLAPKGFGSENMSQSKMLKPSDGIKGVEEFILQVVSEAGPNPCPPIVVGVGIGGTIEKAALLAKKALTRDIGSENPKELYSDLEKRMLIGINNLGIGPQGLGGNTTALAVHIEEFPTHIAGLPVVVNINCHATRHVVRVLGGQDED